MVHERESEAIISQQNKTEQTADLLTKDTHASLIFVTNSEWIAHPLVWGGLLGRIMIKPIKALSPVHYEDTISCLAVDINHHYDTDCNPCIYSRRFTRLLNVKSLYKCNPNTWIHTAFEHLFSVFYLSFSIPPSVLTVKPRFLTKSDGSSYNTQACLSEDVFWGSLDAF